MIQVRNALIGLGSLLAFLGLGILVYNAFNSSSSSLPPATFLEITQSQNIDEAARVSAILAETEPQAGDPDRTTCAEIRGTDYRSETERLWFAANCSGQTTPVIAPAVAQAVVPPANQPSANQAADYTNVVFPMKDNYLSQINFLIDQLGTPRMTDTEWNISVISGLQNAKVLSSRLRDLSAPNCLLATQAGLVSGTREVDIAVDGLAAAVKAQDSNRIASLVTRLKSGADAAERAVSQAQTIQCS